MQANDAHRYLTAAELSARWSGRIAPRTLGNWRSCSGSNGIWASEPPFSLRQPNLLPKEPGTQA
ncbi:hypothetical protein D9M69_717070 [compost metagenome]